jgi:hypothetical protein
MNNSNTQRNIRILVVVLLVVAVAGVAIWYKLFRAAPQPGWITANQRDTFLYGSAGAEENAGIPYWIWLALPRIFPEYLPGPGGYASLGFSWEETIEMPVGFSKKTVGYVRVAGNCAICHAYSRPNGPDEAPTVFAAGPGHTAEVQKLLQFYKQCAQDPRFNANNILGEVAMATKLSFLDRLIYRYILIPRMRQRFLKQDSVMIDAALWRHSQDPHSDPAFRQQMQALEPGLQGAEKDALVEYLKTLPGR